MCNPHEALHAAARFFLDQLEERLTYFWASLKLGDVDGTRA